ncbi:hypothetical protein V6N13_062201 [Hibiscus sabdariffa]|uniref:Uncharacterized protein n=2 Tax=Hibiscus sabdariffa TaxID=183260 RepID=A0ABR2NAG6_9ROSI
MLINAAVLGLVSTTLPLPLPLPLHLSLLTANVIQKRNVVILKLQQIAFAGGDYLPPNLVGVLGFENPAELTASVPSFISLQKGLFLLLRIMLISRLCRVGFRVAQEVSRGGYRYMSRTRYTQGPCRQYRPSLLDLMPETRAFQGAIFEKHHGFSTSASDGASAGGDEEKEARSSSFGRISVTFVSKDGEEIPIQVPIGMSMLEAAHENDIELEGACEGSLACSTCHVVVMDMEYYNKLEDPADEENDMLDLAFGLTETSRLGCQIVASPELDGIRLAIPAATRNFAVDGYVAKPH